MKVTLMKSPSIPKTKHAGKRMGVQGMAGLNRTGLHTVFFAVTKPNLNI